MPTHTTSKPTDTGATASEPAPGDKDTVAKNTRPRISRPRRSSPPRESSSARATSPTPTTSPATCAVTDCPAWQSERWDSRFTRWLLREPRWPRTSGLRSVRLRTGAQVRDARRQPIGEHHVDAFHAGVRGRIRAGDAADSPVIGLEGTYGQWAFLFTGPQTAASRRPHRSNTSTYAQEPTSVCRWDRFLCSEARATCTCCRPVFSVKGSLTPKWERSTSE